jgi:hypothetical protein
LNIERAPIQRFSFIEPRLRLVQDSEIVQRQRDIRVIGFEDLLFNEESAPIEPFGCAAISVCLMQRSEVVQVNRDVVVPGAEKAYENG